MSVLKKGFESKTGGQMLRFATVGAMTTLLDLFVFTALNFLTGHPVLSNIISYSCGLTASYRLNRAWTFQARPDLGKALKFMLFISFGLVISTILVGALAQVVPPFFAKLASVPLVFIWNYSTSALLVFRTRQVSMLFLT